MLENEEILLKAKTCKVCGEEMHKNTSVCPRCGARSMSWMMGDKLILCKSCGKQIAKSADVCPHCGKKQHTASLAPAGLVQTMGNVSSSVGGETVSVGGNMTYNNLTLADGDVIYVEMSLSVQLNPSE